jgi:hypothetical protein
MLSVYSASGGPQGKSHVTFNRANSQYLDAGARTLSSATNGGLTIVAVVRFTGTAGDSERIIELAKWDIVNLYNANAFGVDKLQIYRQGTTANLLFETEILNSVTTRMGSGNGVIVQDRWLTVVARWHESTKQFFFLVNNVGAIVPWGSMGVVDSTPPTSGLDSRPGFQASGTYLGRSWESGSYFNGDIAGVFVVDEYLSKNATSAIADLIVRGVDLTADTSSAPAGSTSLTACTCNVGSTGPDGGTCSACPSNSNSSAWSTAFTSCACSAGYYQRLDPLTGILNLYPAYLVASAESWDSSQQRFLDLSGSGRVGTLQAGAFSVGNVTGNGAGWSVPYVAGTTGTQFSWGAASMPLTFTICSITRYSGAAKRRILHCKEKNWLHGHWMGNAGTYYDDGGNGYETNWVDPNTN